MARVLSGIQPTGQQHLGNYLGAVRNWVAMQDTHDAYFCVVDLHAITAGHDPDQLRRGRIELATTLFAAGLDPERCTVFVQSHVHEHAEMAWLLNCITTMGEAGRMIQFKEKSGDRGESVSVGLFAYPILQAADILLYDATEVPVGDDQRQHIELTRDLAQRFHHRFGDGVFTLPKAVTPPVAARVMDLQDPTAKMSKSATSHKGVVLLSDTPKQIAKKIRSAVTDSDDPPVVRYDRAAKPGIANLLDLYAAVSGELPEDLAAEHADTPMYGPLKNAVADAVVAELEPIQARMAELSEDPGEVERLLQVGAGKARVRASATLARAKSAMGF